MRKLLPGRGIPSLARIVGWRLTLNKEEVETGKVKEISLKIKTAIPIILEIRLQEHEKAWHQLNGSEETF